MRIALCTFDFYSSVHEVLRKLNVDVYKVWTFDVDNKKYNFNLKTREFARQCGAELVAGPMTSKDIIELERNNVDAVLTAGYSYKLPIPPSGKIVFVNTHGSLLPNGRGPWPMPWIILRYPQYAGVTIHEMTNQWDHGNILLQEPMIISSNENLETLCAKTQMKAGELICKLLSSWDKVLAQKKPMPEGGSYWKMPTFPERTINWNSSVEEIDRLIRSFGKFNSLVNFDDLDWLVTRASVWKEGHSYSPGQIVNRQNGEITFAAKDGFVCLTHFERDFE